MSDDTEMTWAVMSRQDYKRRYDVFGESNAELTQRVLEQYAAMQTCTTVEELRAQLARTTAVANMDLGVGAIHDDTLIREVDGVKVTADVIEPKGPGPHPVLVYFHGGGWVIASARDYRQVALRFAEAGFLVINVDYRLAPEAQFPAPYEDCEAAVRWAAEVAEQYGGDPSRIAVGGDSAGANLAAAVAVSLADDETAPAIRAALLIYGLYDMKAILPEDAFMRDAYLGPAPAADLLADPRVSPMVAAAKLPPSFVVVGDADESIDESARLAAELDRVGVPHEYVVVPGMGHAFLNMEFFPQARETSDRMASFLHKTFATSSP